MNISELLDRESQLRYGVPFDWLSHPERSKIVDDIRRSEEIRQTERALIEVERAQQCAHLRLVWSR